MFYRNILGDLRQWKDRSDRKPLIIRGARQVGKTTLINMFAADFDQYIYLNLELNEDRNIFNSQYTFDETIASIFFTKNVKRDYNKTTLIFIDEIQNSAVAVSMMRYFYEKAKNLFVIAAGSLLETLLEKQTSFPVGRVEYCFMYPVTFSEFLKATQEYEAVELLNKVPVPDFAHEKILKLFHRYTLIGGMPEIIQHYYKNQDLVSLNSFYQNLMMSYFDDIEKYAKKSQAVAIIRHAIESAPFEAGQRIKFHGFGHSNYGSREMGEALRTLEKALLIRLIYPTTNVIPPAIPNYRKSPKLQFLDTGLVNYFAGLQKYYFNLKDLNTFYQGIIAEHIVGQELIANHISSSEKIYFWVREEKQANAEVDFILPFRNYLIPIEVKAGKTGTLRSLHQFIDKTNHNFAVRLYAGNVKLEQTKTISGKNFTLLNLPYYLTSQINHYIEEMFVYT